MAKNSGVDQAEIVGGLQLGRRVQEEGEKLRPAERSDADHEKRLISGEAWRDFCRALERTRASPRIRARSPRASRHHPEQRREQIRIPEEHVRRRYRL